MANKIRYIPKPEPDDEIQFQFDHNAWFFVSNFLLNGGKIEDICFLFLQRELIPEGCETSVSRAYYKRWLDYYETIQIRANNYLGQKILDDLNEKKKNMKDHISTGLSITKKRKKIKEDSYQRFYNELDNRIELIENLIYLCLSPKQICLALIKPHKTTEGQTLQPIRYLTPIIFHRWLEVTNHVDRIQFAYKCSADEHMARAEEFMLDWLSKPELDMQHVGIVREVGLFHSRMADYMNRKKYGKQTTVLDEKPQSKVIAGRDMQKFLENLTTIANKINNPEENTEESNDSDEEEYEEFEEI